MSENHFDPFRQAREEAEVKSQETDNHLISATVDTITFDSDLNHISHMSDMALAVELKREEHMKPEILAVTNMTFLKHTFKHLEQALHTRGDDFWFTIASSKGVSRDTWLAYRQSTRFILPPYPDEKTKKRIQKSKLAPRTPKPAWIIGQRLSKTDDVRYDYLAAYRDETEGRYPRSYIAFAIMSPEQPFAELDVIPSREEVQRAYDPERKKFIINYAADVRSTDSARISQLDSLTRIDRLTDEDMQSFGTAHGLMELFRVYDVLDTSDELIESYQRARELAVKLLNPRTAYDAIKRKYRYTPMNGYVKDQIAHLQNRA